MKNYMTLFVLLFIASTALSFNSTQKETAYLNFKCKTLHSGTATEPPQRIQSIQLAFFPGFIYNAVAFGYGIRKENHEHVIEGNSFFIPLPTRFFGVGLHYNYNHYLKNDMTYIPFWGGVSRINAYNIEEGGPVGENAYLQVGSGIGTLLNLNQKHAFKFELGLGIAANFENKSNEYHTAIFKLNAQRNFVLDQTYPIVPAFRFKIRYMLCWND